MTDGPKSRRRPPRRITSSWMRNSALHYLGRYTATTAQLKRVMTRRIDRSLAHHGGDRQEALEALDQLVEQLCVEGYLDDARYARARAEDLHRRGSSLRGIRAKLWEKGLSGELVDDALARLSEGAGDPELAGALAYARRRRLGPFRREDELDSARRRRELAALGRAGFPMDVARRVVDASDPTELAVDWS